MTARLLSSRSAALPLPSSSTVNPQTPSLYWPSEADRAPSHCGNCGARLLRTHVPTADAPLVDVDCLYCSRTAVELKHDGLRMRVPSHLLPEDAPPKRGRPFKQMGPPVGAYTALRHQCADCPVMIEIDHERCRPCHRVHRARTSAHGRLVEILKDGTPRRRDELCETLGVTMHALKNAIDRARKAGAPVVNHRQGVVRLQVAP